MKNFPEILAPAGNSEGLKSAVLHGADAVYFGVSSFNARIMADNFTLDNLSEWVDFCHFFGVKAYLTLNTIVKNSELNSLIEVIEVATKANVDAFIVCDLATVTLCKNIAPTVPLHFSTQFGIHNYEGAKYAKKLGAKRIILSRETPIDEIVRIKTLDIEIETFVHGALCVAFSGNCYLSSAIDGNSGNRGRCKQPCRKKYLSSLQNKEGYYLSTNDLCLVDKVGELAKIGVDSFKIEGRLKSPEYVANTVLLYKKALLGKNYDEELDNVKASYARVFTTKGYLTGSNDGIINPNLQNSAGLKVGRVEKVLSLKNGLKKVVFASSRDFEKGEGIKFIRQNAEIGGCTLANDACCGKYEVYLRADVRVGDTVCLTKLKSLEYNPTIKVDFALEEYDICKYKLTLSGKISHDVYFDTQVNPTKSEQIDGINNVLKKGSAPIIVNNVTVKLASNNLLPFSVLNAQRKRCLTEYKSKLLREFQKGEPQKFELDTKPKGEHSTNIAVILSNDKHLNLVLDKEFEVIYAPYDYNDIDKFMSLVARHNSKIYLGLPTISFEKDIEVLYKTIEKYNTCIQGLYGNNTFVKEIALKYGLEVFCGHGFNVANNIAIKLHDCKVVLSPELSSDEIKQCDSYTYVYGFGHLPLMTFAHCPAKANGYNCNNCPFDKNDVVYSSKEDKFVIKRTKVDRCYFELYSDIPLSNLKSDKFHNILLDMRYSDDKLKDLLENDLKFNGMVNIKYSTKGVL